MKKQTKTYLLLALVVLIWGIIAVKIFGTLSSDDDELPTVQNVEFKPKKVKAKDTFSIAANYRDPFLGTLVQTKKKKINRPKQVKEKTPQIEVIYTGYITDSSTEEKIFFITISGQQYLMNPKDTRQGVSLINGTATQVRIKSNGTTRFVPIQQ